MDPQTPPLVNLLRALQRLIRCIAWVLGGRPYVLIDMFQCTSCGEVVFEQHEVESYKIEPEWWLQLRTCETCGPEDDQYDQWLTDNGLD